MQKTIIPATKVSELHVLVHPHYTSFIDEQQRSPLPLDYSRLKNVSLSQTLRDIASKECQGQKVLACTDLITRFYKNRIDRIRKIPKAHLLVLTNRFVESRESEMSFYGLSELFLEKVRKAFGSFQLRVVDKALTLGSRVAILPDDGTAQMGGAIKALYSPGIVGVPTYVYGETLGLCVDQVADSFQSEAFQKIRLRPSWCPTLEDWAELGRLAITDQASLKR